MPRYDYLCPTCGHREERLVSLSARDAQTCTHATDGVECGAPLERDQDIPLTASTPYAWRP